MTVETRVLSEHRSNGLATVVNDLVSKGGTVLDLGPLSSGTTEVLLGKGCKCYVEDITEVFAELDEEQENFEALIQAHWLPRATGQTFQVILCWDLLNYLTLNSIEVLFSELQPYVEQGTVVHLMQYTPSTKLAGPQRFKLLNNFNYKLLDQEHELNIPVHWHTTIHLLKRMQGYNLRFTHMNQEGMNKNLQEMTLTFGAATQSSETKRTEHVNDISYFSKDREAINLPLLVEWLNNTASKTGIAVLDMGKKTGREIHHLNVIANPLYIEDVYASLVWQNMVDHETKAPISLHSLRMAESTGLGMILSWDILNFLTANQIRELGLLVTKKMNEHAFWHFILYHEHSVPEKPVNFSVESNDQVSLTGSLLGHKGREFASTTALMKLLPDFSVQRFHYGRSEMQIGFEEFLLVKK